MSLPEADQTKNPVQEAVVQAENAIPPYQSVVVETVAVASNYSKETYNFLYNGLGWKGVAYRTHLCFALGLDPNSSGSLNARSFWFALFVSFLETIFTFVPYVGKILKKLVTVCCKSAIQAAMIIWECEQMGIPEEEFPSTLDDVVIVITLHKLECASVVSFPQTDWTSLQEAEIENIIRSRNDKYLGWKLTRLFQIENKLKALVKVPFCYSFSSGFFSYCFFSMWYGGSYTMAKTTVAALKSANVPYDEVKRVLTHWNATWAAHVRKLLSKSRECYLDRNVPKGKQPIVKKKSISGCNGSSGTSDSIESGHQTLCEVPATLDNDEDLSN